MLHNRLGLTIKGNTTDTPSDTTAPDDNPGSLRFCWTNTNLSAVIIQVMFEVDPTVMSPGAISIFECRKTPRLDFRHSKESDRDFR